MLLPEVLEPVVVAKPRRGPAAACDIYAGSDVADYVKVNALRRAKTWAVAQRSVDVAMGIADPIKDDKFRYHWTAKCAHWDEIRHLLPKADE